MWITFLHHQIHELQNLKNGPFCGPPSISLSRMLVGQPSWICIMNVHVHHQCILFNLGPHFCIGAFKWLCMNAVSYFTVVSVQCFSMWCAKSDCKLSYCCELTVCWCVQMEMPERVMSQHAGNTDVVTGDDLLKLMHRQVHELQQLHAQNERLRVSLQTCICKILHICCISSLIFVKQFMCIC